MEHTVIKKWITSSLLILSITSCLSSSVEDLMGPDEDKNGVRDDVDLFIKRQDVKEEYRDAMRQYAFYARESFRYIHNRDESIRNSRLMTLSRNCLTALYEENIKEFEKSSSSKDLFIKYMEELHREEMNLRRALNNKIYNSWARKDAEKKKDKHLSGQIYTMEKLAKKACFFRSK